MAKHGIFVEKTDGTFEFTSKTGLEAITTGITNPFKPSEGVIGTPKLLSHVFTATLGNAVAVHSLTKKIGVSALGMTPTFG